MTEVVLQRQIVHSMVHVCYRRTKKRKKLASRRALPGTLMSAPVPLLLLLSPPPKVGFNFCTPDLA